MISPALTPVLAAILTRKADADEILADAIPVLGRSLRCDRCFLYLRHPQKRVGRIPYCWIAHPHIPTIGEPNWQPEPEFLLQKDPMFAAALRLDPTIFVEDVETADPAVVNREFEQQQFGHQALVHAHLVWQGELWGILQPAVFGRSRSWEEFDRVLISQTVQQIAPLAAAYVQQVVV